MRVLFAVSSWPGHYFPMVPLGWALRAAGHDVRVLCSDTDVDPLTQAGMTPVPVLSSTELMRGARLVNLLVAMHGAWPYPDPPLHPDTAEPVDFETFDFAAWYEKFSPLMLANATHNTDAAVAYARSWRPDLVVHDIASLEGSLIAKVTGVPDVLQLWGPWGTGDQYNPVDGDPGKPEKPVLDFSGAFERYGLDDPSDHDVDYVLDPCPEAIRPLGDAKRIPSRFIPYNGPGAVPLDIPERTDRPRVCVVWGRSASQIFGPSVNKMSQVVAAATALGAEVLLLATPSDAADAGPLPDTVHVRANLPLNLVLSDCDAVVHYGGGGVTMTSVVCGVPQLLLPCGFDQTTVASRITKAGAGLEIRNHEADVDRIKAALARLLGESSFTTSAGELAESANALQTPSDVVGTLRELAS
ncbi:nucleotide disphospho-sugar-binding domain-containing protein [Amycolatopsis lurida]